MGRTIYCPIASITMPAESDVDIWQLMAGSSVKCRLLGWEVTSDAIAADPFELRLLRGPSSGGTGGTAATEVKADDDDGSITGVVTTDINTPSTPGNVLQHFVWEQLGPLGMIYTPEMAPILDVETSMKLNIITTPSAAWECSGWICWEEL